MNTVSVCMIVKNEEANIKRSLLSATQIADEIIIIDTGSTDKTKEIALQFTDKVYDYKWKNDFSDARNFSITKATNEFILVLDADEVIETIDKLQLQKMVLSPTKVGRLLRVNEYSRGAVAYKYHERVGRFFSKLYYKYEGVIHEQLVPINHSKVDYYDIPLIVQHSGYEGNLDLRKKKTDRNITLLRMALEKNPEDPYLIYQIGKSYYMEENYKSACTYFSQVLSYDLDIRLEYVQDLIESYGYSLLNTEQYEAAMQLLNVYDEFAHSADFIFMIALVLMNNGKFLEAIEEFLKATRKKACKMEGVNGYLSFYNIGVIYECLGDKGSSIKYYKKCGDYKMAKQRIDSILG